MNTKDLDDAVAHHIDLTKQDGQTIHQAFRTLQHTLARVRESYEGCSCECIEANQDEHGFWTPKHECLPCEVKRVMRETIWHAYGDRVQPGFNPLKKPPPFGD